MAAPLAVLQVRYPSGYCDHRPIRSWAEALPMLAELEAAGARFTIWARHALFA